MQSTRTVQTVVVLLGVIALGALAGLVFLAATDDLTDTLAVALVGMVTGPAGIIGGLLARTDSVDVKGMAQLKAAEEESFLPQLQASLDKAKAEGHSDGLASAMRHVATLVGPAEPVNVVGAQVDYAEPGAQDLSDDDEPPDPFEVEAPGVPPDPTEITDDDPLAAPAR